MKYSSDRTLTRIAVTAGAVLAAGAAAVYVARILRSRAAPAAGVRVPSAGRPLAVVRGDAAEA